MLDLLFLVYAKISGFCLVAGFLLLAHAHNRKNYIKYLFERGTKTEGKVIEISRNPGSLFNKEEGEGFAPVVEYTTISGNTLKHHSTTYQTPCKYHVGQTVPLWYINYKSRREAALEDDQPGDLPRKLFIVGMILLLIGLPKVLLGLLKIV